jgi:hypothetical protein
VEQKPERRVGVWAWGVLPGVASPLCVGSLAHEATRLWLEMGHLQGVVTAVIMDGKADDQALFAECQRQRGMTLLTTPRKNSEHTEAR